MHTRALFGREDDRIHCGRCQSIYTQSIEWMKMTDIPPPSTYHKLTSSTKHTTQPDKPSQQPSEQKPKLTHLIKQQLARSAPIRENIYTIPNLLTFSRLLATPAICYFIVNDQFAYAVALFGYAGVTDLLDGWIARRWNLQSVVGSVVDPMADKALMVALTTTLAWKGLLPGLPFHMFHQPIDIGRLTSTPLQSGSQQSS